MGIMFTVIEQEKRVRGEGRGKKVSLWKQGFHWGYTGCWGTEEKKEEISGWPQELGPSLGNY